MNARLPVQIAISTLAAFAAVTAFAQDWSADWKFHQGDAKPDAPTSTWQAVSIPHTWNATDASDGGSDSGKAKDAYYRGPGWYAKTFRTPDEWSGKRVFLRFQGVSSVADVYFNGTHLGQHRGGFSAFCYEVTPYLAKSGENDLRVRADNTAFDDVPPLSGDFPVFGGFYRPMEVLVMPQTCITPLDYASPGIYISQNKVTKEAAEISVLAKVIRSGDSALPVGVECRVLDGDQEVAKGASQPVELRPGGEAALDVPLTIKNPHLWNGRKDPHMYSVEVMLKEGGKPVEQSTQPLGLRFYHADANGFFLNGEPYRLYGVNRHQDREGKGWAISREDIEEDHRLIMEMGARAVRFSHYQHPSLAYELCDRDGLLAWAEIPLVSKISASPEFAANARQQLVEMIRQNFNRPSIFTWGIFNELYMAKGPDATALVKDLNALAKREDPTRPTTAGSHKYYPAICDVSDLLGFNEYPGWYWGKPSDMVWKLNDFLRDSGTRGACVSEYGAGASINHHEIPARMPKHNGPWHPEEWQAIVHETAWDAIRSNPSVWGSFVWNMFDFASDWRNEGDRPGINDKGLVTRDRKTPKDAFFFYKANWSTKPVLHITSKRFDSRKDAVTDVKIYTNAAGAELFLNGKSLGTMAPDSLRRAVWKNVSLAPGKNTLEARSTDPATAATDSCTIFLDPKPAYPLSLDALRNPVMAAKDNLRDPSVLKSGDGYHIFYSRYLGSNWNAPENWTVATAFTRDFVRFENDRDISPHGFASPGDPVTWHGKHILPFQTYPKSPSTLCYSTTTDFQTWSEPVPFLPEANRLAWNTLGRAIDPTLVVEGDTLHCFFVGSDDTTAHDGRKFHRNLLGHAVTSDPNLEKWKIVTQDAPLIGSSKDAPDGVENIAVFRTGDHWTMIYSEGLADQHLARATSPDLTTWNLEGPLDIPRQSWMTKKYGAPFVWQEVDHWMMILMGQSAKGHTTFGLLTSPDGTKWTSLPE